jgi:hypothetical protein
MDSKITWLSVSITPDAVLGTVGRGARASLGEAPSSIPGGI